MEMPEPREQSAHEVEDHVAPQLEKVATRLAYLNEQFATYIRANPGRCLFGAATAGYVIARVARRR